MSTATTTDSTASTTTDSPVSPTTEARTTTTPLGGAFAVDAAKVQSHLAGWCGRRWNRR